MNSGKIPVRHRIVLAGVLLAGVFTRVYRLGDKIMWLDEGIMWKVARRPIAGILEYYRLEQHSPLPQIIDHFWVKMAGDSMFSLHLEPVLWSVLALLIFTVTVFKFFPWRVALAAATVFSLSAFIPEFAQNFRYQSIGTFFAVVWLAALLSYKTRGGTGWLILYASSLALFVHTHLYMVFAVVSLSAYFVFFRKEFQKKMIPLLAANGAAIASLVPKIIQIIRSGVSGKNPEIPLSEVLEHLARVPVGGLVKVFYSFFAGRSFDPENLHPALFAILIVLFSTVLLLSFFQRGFRPEAWLCASVIGGTVFLGWLGMLFKGMPFAATYFVPLSIFFSLMLGIGADRVAQWKPALLSVMLVLYAVISLSFLSCYWKNLDRPENYRSLLESVADNARPGDFLNISPPYTSSFDYYWKGDIPAHTFYGDHDADNAPHNNYFYVNAGKFQLDEEKMRKWHVKVASHYKRVWMFWILGEKNTEDRAGFARPWMDRHYKILETRPYRMFPYSRQYTGKMVLYRIRPLPAERRSDGRN